MTSVMKEKHHNDQGRYFEYLVAMIAGANTGFIFSLLATLDWVECLVLMFALATLAGGAVFTFFEMRALN
jgi:hypothetical protein